MDFLGRIRPKPKVVGDDHYLFRADCLDVLKQIPDKSIRLIVTDPPYNIGLKYNSYRDKKGWNIYYSELEERLNEMARILTDDGSLYLINYPEINARTVPIIDKTGLIFRRWLTWHYPSNIGTSKSNYTRTQRSVLFYTKTKKNIFNREQVLQPYKNPDVSKIKKLIKKGKMGRTPYDTLDMKDLFEIFYEELPDVLNFNLLKNVCKDRILEHPCQLPPTLLKVFVKVSSNPGDFVLDAYAGTFTTSLVAKELGRKSIGIEIDSLYLKYGLRRLKDGKR